MTLLIFTPTWTDPETGREMIRPEVEAAIKDQVGVEFDWHVTSDNPYPIGDYRNVLHQYQRAHEWFLRQGDREGRPYEALLTIEHDNLLPDPEAVRRMAETPGDVVYAPYILRHGARPLSTWQYINDRNLGMSLSSYRLELKRARDDVIHRVSGAGFGCTLIRRHVLEAIEFSGATDRDQNWCPDLRFAEDCLRKRFVSNGRFDVPVLHWDENRWRHPFENRRNSVAIYIALETANAIAAGRFVRLNKDQRVDLTDEEAGELFSLGLIESIANVTPPPPVTPQAELPLVAPVAEVEITPPARRRRASPKG